jgi:hypothetical protein
VVQGIDEVGAFVPAVGQTDRRHGPQAHFSVASGRAMLRCTALWCSRWSPTWVPPLGACPHVLLLAILETGVWLQFASTTRRCDGNV